ncbi:unnamed protein product [Brachionus calyciflorus]|uniref:CARD domain-containing protein n=1 Tax=Brachionus calyciflorus TaxID=104777 RepID=A0A814GBY9_9BILA|nr:unnamed protein product [Brachionus calyciflorus]
MGENYNVDQVNLNRLKVNRINLIQGLNVNDDLITQLIKQKIIDYEKATEIMNSKTREDKAKNLVDCLIQSKPNELRKDWYVLFRSILHERNYTDLITFLDNTIIKKPKFVEKISSLSNNSYLVSNSQVLIFTASDSTPSSAVPNRKQSNALPSLLTRPEYLFEQLKISKDFNDINQLDIELDIFYFFKNLEASYLMLKSKDEQFKDAFILDTPDCKNILNLSSSFMGVKYFKALSKTFDIDMLKYLTDTLIENFNKSKVIRLSYYDCLDELVFKLLWSLIRNERNDLADLMLSEYLNHLEFLDTYVNRINAENNLISTKNKTQPIYNSKELVLTSRFYALSNFIIIKNNLFDFQSCWIMFDKAVQILDLCLIEDHRVSTTILYYSIANTYMECSDFDKAFEYINKSLMTVCYDDDLLIDILGTACSCYSNKWLIDKAESLAILAIQSAKAIYGTNSAHFVRALLIYCNFSVEFLQDDSSIKICEYTLNMTKKVYACETVQVADAFKCLSKAYALNKNFKDNLYYEYAQKCLKIAQEYFTQDSPRLVPFQACLVSALQWRSIYAEEIEIKRVNLNDAYNLCFNLIQVNTKVYGEMSIQSAKYYRLFGSILYYMERDMDSEKIHKKSLEILENLVPKSNFHYLLSLSTLGVFYKMIGNLNDSIAVLLEVTNELNFDKIQNLIVYCKWIPSVFMNLSECYKLKMSEELSKYYQKQADNMRLSGSNFKSNNRNHQARYDLLSVELNRLPPSDLNKFLKEFIEQK